MNYGNITELGGASFIINSYIEGSCAQTPQGRTQYKKKTFLRKNYWENLSQGKTSSYTTDIQKHNTNTNNNVHMNNS